ncbi:hypothetical protein J5N97_000657 [Dioscorea zingiberensis]|uniref:Uncharacterized protein n=1 Tax=Dioscorea zingiberensis TaxID=325984 RepID=A0A9D5H1H9_9LILI|nr:hypothetical protein J5N97_000657 [Dioscorea zingiberensis]
MISSPPQRLELLPGYSQKGKGVGGLNSIPAPDPQFIASSFSSRSIEIIKGKSFEVCGSGKSQKSTGSI